MSESKSDSYLEGLKQLVDEHRLLSQQHRVLTREIALLKKSMEEMLTHAQAIFDLNSDIQISEPRELAPIFKQQVEELDFSVRAYNCLKNSKIFTVADLVQKTESEIIRIKHCGRKSSNEIEMILATQGLHLAMSREDMLAWTPPDPANPLFR